jgi:hypothetical protein
MEQQKSIAGLLNISIKMEKLGEMSLGLLTG